MLEFINEFEAENSVDHHLEGRERSSSFVNMFELHSSESNFTQINLDLQDCECDDDEFVDYD
jgi:hypothetical protein